MNIKEFTENSYYNAIEDLNRVNENIQEIKELLEQHNYIVNLPYLIKTDYTRADFPTISTIKQVKENILALEQIFYTPPGVPDIIVKTDRKQTFNYEEANAIEKNLAGLHELIEAIEKSFKYSGCFYAGQEIYI